MKLREYILYYGENAMTTKLNPAYTQKPTLTHNIQNIVASQVYQEPMYLRKRNAQTIDFW